MPSQDATLERMLPAFDQLESNYYQSPRERANAIALSGERELLIKEAMRQHAEQLRAALRYEQRY